MGIVYHAIDPNIGRPVAIKTIQLGAVRNPDEQKRLRERLFREARSAGMLSHPGIVTIYDVEQQGDLAYIAMEFVDGPTLDQLLSAPEPLPPEQMFGILSQTATALDYAHQKGIVHRDIKPANIMIAVDGAAKITDFGIAKITTSEQFTMTGSIVGTPHYMSPEQVQGQSVDGRSDQFSLAVIAYEMLTGEKPYTGEHLTTVVYKIVAEEPALPHRINPSLSGAIDAVLRRALAKKPDSRYRNCQEFVDALEKACAATKSWKSMPRGGSLNEPTIADLPRTAAMLQPARRPRREDSSTAERPAKRKPGFATFLMAVLMVGALLALIGWQASPWLTANRQRPAKLDQTKTASAAPIETPAKPPEIAPSPAPPLEPPPRPAGDDAKPSPMSAVVKPAPTEIAPPPSTPGVQPVAILSSPGGATATMDSRADAVCTTPCSLDALPGRHRFSFTMPGYQSENREFNVGNSPLELPLIVLRAETGMLMLSSVPPGAAVLVNGKRVEKVTPTALQLAPGSYKISVEKDGRQSSGTVDIHNGDTKVLRITLQ